MISNSQIYRGLGFVTSLVMGIGFFAEPTEAATRSANPVRKLRARPNIVLIFTDDQRLDQMQYLPKTQQFFSENGILFSNAIATTPLCCPSRSSILTGNYAHTTGIHLNASRGADLGGAVPFYELGWEAQTMGVALQNAGYRTSYIGKYLNGYNNLIPAGRVPPGWTSWFAFFGLSINLNIGYYNYTLSQNGALAQFFDRPQDYSTDALAGFAEGFAASSPTPFFLTFAPYAPHRPSTPAPRHAALYPEVVAPRSPNFGDSLPPSPDRPMWVRTQTWTIEKEVENDLHFRDAARSLAAVDDAVERLVRAVSRRGELKNTVFLFTSDNGYSNGAHRWVSKECPYEECLRVPFAVAAKGELTPGSNDSLVANIDLAPTIAAIAGTSMGTVDGKSLLHILKGQSSSVRDEILAEGFGTDLTGEECQPVEDCNIPPFSAIRTLEWKLIEYATDEHELYHLPSDPYETLNLANNPGYQDVLMELKFRLGLLKTPG